MQNNLTGNNKDELINLSIHPSIKFHKFSQKAIAEWWLYN